MKTGIKKRIRGPHSEETKAKIGLANSIALRNNQNAKNKRYKRNPFSEEHLEKLRISHLGKISGMKGKHHSDKTKLKISISKKGRPSPIKGRSWPDNKKGENHWNWKGDNCVGRNERNDSLYQNWVRRVKNRDGWKCKINDKNCKGYCTAHHILSWKNYPELRYNINNGITLCQFHHPLKREEERRLIPFFQKMVEAK